MKARLSLVGLMGLLLASFLPALPAQATCAETSIFEARGASNFGSYGTWGWMGNYLNRVDASCYPNGTPTTQLILFNTAATDWIEGGLYRQSNQGVGVTHTWWEYGIYPNSTSSLVDLVDSSLTAAKFEVKSLGQYEWIVAQDLTGGSHNTWTTILDVYGLLNTHGIALVEISEHGAYQNNAAFFDEWGVQYEGSLNGTWVNWNQAQCYADTIADWHQVVLTAYHVDSQQNSPPALGC